MIINEPTQSITDLKAQAYDAIAQIEYWQKLLQELNKRIAEMAQQQPEQRL
jgi:hypothetical protein